MGFFSKLKSIFGNDNSDSSNDDSTSKTNESEETLVDDIGNYHRHDFSSLTEFEQEKYFETNERNARIDRVQNITETEESFFDVSFLETFVKPLRLYFMEGCMAMVARSSSHFLHATNKVGDFYKLDEDDFSDASMALFVAIEASVWIRTYVSFTLQGKELPSEMIMPATPPKNPYKTNWGLFIGMIEVAQSYVINEAENRPSMNADIENMKHYPHEILPFTLARIYDLFEDIRNKGTADHTVIIPKQEYEFAKHHFYRAAYIIATILYPKIGLSDRDEKERKE